MVRTCRCVALVVTTLIAASAWAQPQSPAFEVATIREIEPGARIPASMTVTPARVDIVGYSLSALLFEAFKVPAYQLVYPAPLRAMGNPRFEIHATFPAGATRAQLPGMLQTLLRERFGMVSRVESRSLPAYDLVVAAPGKLREVAPVDERAKDFSTDPAGQPLSDRLTGPSDEQVRSMTIPIGMIASQLTTNLDRPVIDRTGLTGVYQFRVELGPNLSTIRGLMSSGVTTTIQGTPLSEPTGVSTFKAIEGLGLKLEERRAPIDVIVVDAIERLPTAN